MRDYRRILITGGAGFVGSGLAIALKNNLFKTQVVAFDNLRRRGSELNLERLKKCGVRFLHGDIRNFGDIETTGEFDLLIDCSAEASVHAGYQSSPRYVVQTNLLGTTMFLEAARLYQSDIVFMSTSRVYPIARLRELPLEINGERVAIPESQSGAGWSTAGISTEFPLDGSRSLYGATKLASELLLTEYAEMYDLRVITNRCGVLTGPWQMGHEDQGFVALWAARHKFGGNLSYRGFDGKGYQVRDILHVHDLYELLKKQLADLESTTNTIYNVGGGPSTSVSLAELTSQCHRLSSEHLEIGSDSETSSSDIPYYVTDNSTVSNIFDWAPKQDIEFILDDIFRWLTDHQRVLQPFFRDRI